MFFERGVGQWHQLCPRCFHLFGDHLDLALRKAREPAVVALGAQRQDVLSLVVGQGLRLALIGSVVGLIGALAATRLVSNLLFGVTPTDAFTFSMVTLGLLLVTLLACLIPARRATKVDPLVALRYE